MARSNVSVVFTTELPEAPARSNKGADPQWKEAADALRENEGQWAQVVQKPVRSNASATAHYIRTGTMKAFGPTGHFEATVRAAVDGSDEFGVYARYVGEAGAVVENGYTEFTVKQLRELCKKNDLPSSGSKQDLADRLLASEPLAVSGDEEAGVLG